MSRQIKFRVWDKRQKEWFPIKNAICLVLNPESTDLCLLTKQGPYPIPQTGQEDGGLNRYILEQFTGLLDSEGKEIYEGDILFHKNENQFVRVEFSNGAFCFYGLNKRHPEEGFVLTSEYEPEIIISGNVHQNPELLPA